MARVPLQLLILALVTPWPASLYAEGWTPETWEGQVWQTYLFWMDFQTGPHYRNTRNPSDYLSHFDDGYARVRERLQAILERTREDRRGEGGAPGGWLSGTSSPGKGRGSRSNSGSLSSETVGTPQASAPPPPLLEPSAFFPEWNPADSRGRSSHAALDVKNLSRAASHPSLRMAWTLNDLGNAWLMRQEEDPTLDRGVEALRFFRKAIAIVEEDLGPRSPWLLPLLERQALFLTSTAERMGRGPMTSSRCRKGDEACLLRAKSRVQEAHRILAQSKELRAHLGLSLEPASRALAQIEKSDNFPASRRPAVTR